MVKITNGVNVFEVTRGAFDGIYSRQGYTIVEEHKLADAEKTAAPEKTEDELFVESIIEKPISQWNKTEIKRFAAIKEIDISGVKSADEAKELIKAFLEENE
ncbi:MAG: hypothetical protein IKK92_02045 [Prevotella sp.]|nr:hypothetical protein [Prevotella sp.]